jgi:hypothetical protein
MFIQVDPVMPPGSLIPEVNRLIPRMVLSLRDPPNVLHVKHKKRLQDDLSRIQELKHIQESHRYLK